MKRFTLIYTDGRSTESKAYDFQADSKAEAEEHARKLCADNGWTFGYVRRASTDA